MKFIPCRYILKQKATLAALALSAIVLSGCNAGPQGKDGGASNNTATNSATNDAVSAPIGEPTVFVNTPEGLKGKLKENYVDFSFSSPSSWEFQEDGRSDKAQNFVKVERSLPDKTNGEFTLENLAIGYFKHSNNAARNAELLPKTVKLLSDQFAGSLAGYKKVSQGPTKIGAYSGYEFRFQSTLKTPTKGNVQLWGRAVLLLEPKTTKGVALLMLASSLAPEIKGPADVGVKGELPIVLKTFKFGKTEAAKTN